MCPEVQLCCPVTYKRYPCTLWFADGFYLECTEFLGQPLKAWEHAGLRLWPDRKLPEVGDCVYFYLCSFRVHPGAYHWWTPFTSSSEVLSHPALSPSHFACQFFEIVWVSLTPTLSISSVAYSSFLFFLPSCLRGRRLSRRNPQPLALVWFPLSPRLCPITCLSGFFKLLLSNDKTKTI